MILYLHLICKDRTALTAILRMMKLKVGWIFQQGFHAENGLKNPPLWHRFAMCEEAHEQAKPSYSLAPVPRRLAAYCLYAAPVL